MTEAAVHSERFIDMLEHLLGRGHAVRFRADGWSMYPTIRYGEVIVVQPLSGSTPLTGDILLYRRSEGAIAHRVIGTTWSAGGRPKLIFRGDAANCCDPPIDTAMLLGRVVAVERDGRTLQLGYLNRIWSPVIARMLWHLRAARRSVTASLTGRTR
jgi:signal peptidase I